MATYEELRDLFSEDAMLNRMDVAVMKAAQVLIDGTPTASDEKWAASVFANPRGEASKAYRYVLAVNSNSPVGTILAVTDTQIQSAVDAAVSSLVAAFNAA